jgi:hypothetical protein
VKKKIKILLQADKMYRPLHMKEYVFLLLHATLNLSSNKLVSGCYDRQGGVTITRFEAGVPHILILDKRRPVPLLEFQMAHIFRFSRYSDSLRTGRSVDRIPVGTRFSAPIQTSPGAHPASCTIGTGSFPGVKASGVW